jgi:hypothetical protein
MAVAKVQDAVAKAVEQATDRWATLTTGQKVAVGITGGVTSLYLVGAVIKLRAYRKKPSSFELTGGSISSSAVKSEFQAYADVSRGGGRAAPGVLGRSFRDRSSELKGLKSSDGRERAPDHTTRPPPLSAQSYGTDGTGTGIIDREQTVHLVDVFYSLVTDIYGGCRCRPAAGPLQAAAWHPRGAQRRTKRPRQCHLNLAGR